MDEKPTPVLIEGNCTKCEKPCSKLVIRNRSPLYCAECLVIVKREKAAAKLRLYRENNPDYRQKETARMQEKRVNSEYRQQENERAKQRRNSTKKGQ